ncbi:MAG: hypothetical protein CR972_03750 [Candidatus Moraniibacteriota bacterium]|nr:MAG: hypothetical protein CR972_03750 [Candidatus Moranbacteria bacterium]
MKNKYWLKNKPIAHRGLWTENIPENSFFAFENAIENGWSIELDVQMTSDGKLVVFHDWKIDRMTDMKGKITKISSKNISNVYLGNTKQKIPFFVDLLDFVDGRVPILIEMKYRGFRKKTYIENLFSALEGYEGKYALSSFNPFLVKQAKEKFGNILCGQNFSDYKESGFIIGRLKKASVYFLWKMSLHIPDFIVCCASMIPNAYIEQITKKEKLPLLVWAIKDKKEYIQKKQYIDNYIFDQKIFEI